MDDGYMPSYVNQCKRYEELYNKYIEIVSQNAKMKLQLAQAQKMIDELDMLRVKLTEKNNELHEEINGLTDIIDYIQ